MPEVLTRWHSSLPSFSFSSLLVYSTILLPFLMKAFFGLESPCFFHDGGCSQSYLAMLEDVGQPETSELAPALPPFPQAGACV